MKKLILLLSLLVVMFLVGCTQESIDPQSVEDVTEEDLAELPEDLQPQITEESALAGQAVNWGDCEDSDSATIYDKNSLLTKSTTTYGSGSKEDKCYTWYEGTSNEKTRLIEGICRQTRSGSKFSYWYADCNQKFGDGFECVDGACIEVVEEEFSGIEGIVLTVDPSNPPQSIIDQETIVALIDIENKGGYEVGAEDCFVRMTGFDYSILNFGPGVTQSCSGNLESLSGGESIELNFEGNINLPLGVLNYTPELNFIACYRYHTGASPNVCVDPLFYQISTEPNICVPQDINMQGGQGAPVGVSYVGVDMIGDKAIFEINVENFGAGTVLSSSVNIQGCTQTINYNDFNKVDYNVQLSGGTLDHCLPNNFVNLNNNKGKIVCSFDVVGNVAFETDLIIDLDYKYIESKVKPVAIFKSS